MSILDNELIKEFLDESREHLDGIEDDLMTLEKQGANVDENLINKVFRAVHSIKGTAGFFGLDNVKDLAHGAENVFGQIRKGELVPNPRIVSILLEAIDVLSGMIGNVEESECVDISGNIQALTKIMQGSLGEEDQPAIEEKIDIHSSSGEVIFQVTAFDFIESAKAEKGGEFVFLIEYDMIDDIERKGKNPLGVIVELQQLAAFIDSKIDFSAVGTLCDFSASPTIPFYALVSTIIDPEVMLAFLEIDENKVTAIPPELYIKDEVAIPEVAKPAEDLMEKESAGKLSAEQTQAPMTGKVATVPPKDTGTTKAASKSPVKMQKAEPTTIRVGVKVIDKLMTLAGELVLTRNQLLQSAEQKDLYLIDHATQRVNNITTELQDAIMSTRMQSVSIVFNKFKRVVYEMSKNLNKKIRIEIEGSEVELDKTIIEAIGDPLTHLVRNSIDHGIELPQEREQAGKNAEGFLRLAAFHKAGQVIIEIQDDGAGINTERVKEKALSTKLHTAQELDAMDEKALQRLIFKPGFSTAREVSDISGRGVGMDVVHSNLSAIGGVVDLESKFGIGSTVRIKLPLTLAILPTLLVACGDQRFAIPQANLVELQRIPASEVKTKVEKISNVNVMRLRGELLPLVRLNEALGIKSTYKEKESRLPLPDNRINIADRRTDEAEETKAETRIRDDRRVSAQSATNIAIVAAGDFHFGMIVDNLLDSVEIVVKPLGRHISHCRNYAGATILGDGQPALILDIRGISDSMDIGEMSKTAKVKKEKSLSKIHGGKDAQSLLIIENAPGQFFAVPLGLVERIEKIHTAQIEMIGNRRAMKYRGGSLPLFGIEEFADVGARPEDSTLFAIIFKFGGREGGLLASSVIDVIDTNVDLDEFTHKQPGIFGSLIISEQITMLVDLHGITAHCMPEWVTYPEEKDILENKAITVLVVEDSNFFLNQIKSFIEEAGYQVMTAGDGVEALEALVENGQSINIVLTDIEMPRLDGFGLVEKVRNDDRFKDIPVIALTSVMGKLVESRGEVVGIDEYLIKLDRDQILERCRHYIEHGRNPASMASLAVS
jgi:two-component system, chemotaxis family, sensor kinase CheA